ncbi:PepSY-associated TM helix domain-containing protein [Kutzneria sp. CA-103260]|uniref:PepSY-associated TM helix domain-containing protein n=1 Tax=Kutzneria sp. CA-103260 TaxID=2802641 RepID=UPI001BA7AFD8|nr:PepSY-associated TM helix domain-containing protein [Kutzneria sp. CA-103260]QUQ71668.1 PepSY-associated TM region [Kutzneria sp. CA-103260]
MTADTERQGPSTTDTLTRTEAARVSAARGSRFRRWLRRRPVRRAMVLTHRWTSLVLGLFLVIETTSGAILLYRAEYFRATHAELYQHTDGPAPISLSQARDLVRQAHPDFTPAWVSNDQGIIAVGDPTFTYIYAVDPGTGHLNGYANINDGFMGLMANIHDCALTCPTDAGYVAWMATPILGQTLGGILLVVLGLLMVLLAITGLITWWPGFRRFSHGFRVRLHRGRFARDYDLHNVIGLVAVPFVLMWGVTGAAFELPAVENAWLAITGGTSVDANRYTFTPDPAAANAADIGLDQAVSTALQRHPGDIRYVSLPNEDSAYYGVSISGSYAPYNARAFFGGDVFVYVDAQDAAQASVVDGGNAEPLANTFYEKVFEPAHFGWLVNGWWRIIWVVLGLTPLALMITGLSTWLFRAGTKRRRRAKA